MADKAGKIKHVGMIMDGNRRWARKHKLESVLKGHEKGGDIFMDVCTWCQDLEIPYLTVYAFSYDNFNRTEEEVTGLFQILEDIFVRKLPVCLERDIRVVAVGNFDLLPEKTVKTLKNAMEKTSHCQNLVVNIAIAYGGHDETVRAAKKIAQDVLDGKISIDDIDMNTYTNYLDLHGCPEMDLMIRTGGDMRLSGFFPWETSYSEFVFTDTLWPDFSFKKFKKIVDEYYDKTRVNKGK